MTATPQKTPDVSVVMAVHNGATQIRDTIESILCQRDVDFEFIIVDDGSTDSTPEILKEFVNRDDRIHVVHQVNTGLTQALRNGCSMATSQLIARQDTGDLSLPDRLHQQREQLCSRPNIVATGCSVRWIGPQSEHLGDWVRNQSDQQTTRDLVESGIGFVHPSVMFRRDAYQKAGGYRGQFRFAQDHDLWYRMAEQGLLATCPEVLFEYRMDIAGISPQNRVRQQRLGELARKCFLARRNGESEESLLAEANQVSWRSPDPAPTSNGRGEGAAAYFVGSQLYKQRDNRCRAYLKMAMGSGDNRFRAAWKYATSVLTCGTVEQERSQQTLKS